MCEEWCSHAKSSWCIVYAGMWYSTVKCVGLVCYCSVQVSGDVVPWVVWSLASSTSPKWSSGPLWSGSWCPISMLHGVSSIPMVHLIDFCQHLCFGMVFRGCLIPGVNFINLCSCTLQVPFSCKVFFHEVALFPLVFNVVEEFFVCVTDI